MWFQHVFKPKHYNFCQLNMVWNHKCWDFLLYCLPNRRSHISFLLCLLIHKWINSYKRNSNVNAPIISIPSKNKLEYWLTPHMSSCWTHYFIVYIHVGFIIGRNHILHIYALLLICIQLHLVNIYTFCRTKIHYLHQTIQ